MRNDIAEIHLQDEPSYAPGRSISIKEVLLEGRRIAAHLDTGGVHRFPHRGELLRFVNTEAVPVIGILGSRPGAAGSLCSDQNRRASATRPTGAEFTTSGSVIFSMKVNRGRAVCLVTVIPQ